MNFKNKPTEKSKEIEDFLSGLSRRFGFGDRRMSVQSGVCVFCKAGGIDNNSFKDENSYKEFRNSGICQKCQDSQFAAREEGEF